MILCIKIIKKKKDNEERDKKDNEERDKKDNKRQKKRRAGAECFCLFILRKKRRKGNVEDMGKKV